MDNDYLYAYNKVVESINNKYYGKSKSTLKRERTNTIKESRKLRNNIRNEQGYLLFLKSKNRINDINRIQEKIANQTFKLVELNEKKEELKNVIDDKIKVRMNNGEFLISTKKIKNNSQLIKDEIQKGWRRKTNAQIKKLIKNGSEATTNEAYGLLLLLKGNLNEKNMTKYQKELMKKYDEQIKERAKYFKKTKKIRYNWKDEPGAKYEPIIEPTDDIIEITLM